MALTGLDIYKLLPKTNCKECGFATCLAFAMALAQKKVSLDKCPSITAQAKEALESAAQPPVKLVTIGAGDKKIEIGNETVIYRHEQKFYHQAAIGLLIEDSSAQDRIDKAIAEIKGLEFERVGQKIAVNLICVRNSSGVKDKFVSTVKKVAAGSDLCIALDSIDAAAALEAARSIRGRRPLVICRNMKILPEFVKAAREENLPLAVSASTLEEAAQATDIAKRSGVDEIIINLDGNGLAKTIQDFTYARRAALKKNFRALGYPFLAFTSQAEPHLELAEAVSYVLKYAGIVIMKNRDKDFIFPLLVARQDIYQDPQKPVQVEPKIYEVGKVTKDSPVAVTTNFSITYFTVAAEVESSKVPTYIVVCDSEGMSVLTAWAAEKFTAEQIADTLKKSGIEGIVSHKKIIIPGYVSVLSGKLEEVSGWKVSVGPREASGIPNYLRNWK
ncbi:MAG: acetyl-CoA decarbonylase/synthase complex subunit gamma [Candidatus Omnitrophica bacterium]|nr:acetyl-CoA decarbonylase/synthase complex subunit gamma [Candidatus Omnitrophota bacterium]